MASWCLDCIEAKGLCETCQVANLVVQYEARTGRCLPLRAYAGVLRLVQQEVARRNVLRASYGVVPRRHPIGRRGAPDRVSQAPEATVAQAEAGVPVGGNV